MNRFVIEDDILKAYFGSGKFVYCTDGQIRFDKDQKHYIDTLFFPGTRAKWNETIDKSDWRNKRRRKIVCIDEL